MLNQVNFFTSGVIAVNFAYQTENNLLKNFMQIFNLSYIILNAFSDYQSNDSCVTQTFED